MNQTYQKPIPKIQPWSKEYWKGTKEHKLLIQTCNECEAKIFYPRKFCPECWSGNLGWTEAKGTAKVYSFTITRDMVEPKFMPDLPYVLAMVDLDEGIRMMTRIVECDHDKIQIGMDVEVVFEDISDDCALPMFRPFGLSRD
ncbi:MAG: Zn-ribbon domain-containing OB-fold protein [Desulfobacteraceae bacterium]|nr:Zn-ribbon domain-containing OB-fold protein [Desulfobacteraceae bacterium]